MRRAAYSHQEKLYLERHARYPEAQGEDIRRRKAELEAFTACASARKAAQRELPAAIPYTLWTVN